MPNGKPIAARDLAKKSGLSEETIEMLRLLGHTLDPISDAPPAAIPPGDQKKLGRFLMASLGKESIRKQALKLQGCTTAELGFGSKTFQFMFDLAYHTRHIDRFKSVQSSPKIGIMLDIRGVSSRLSKKMRLTLQEYGVMCNINGVLKTLNRINTLIDPNSELGTFHKSLKAPAQLVDKLKKGFEEEFTMPAGALLFKDADRAAAIKGVSQSYGIRVISFVSGYIHAAIGFRGEKGQPTISHIDADYKREDFTLKHYLYNDTFALDLFKLIPKDYQEVLSQKYGKEKWKAQVEKLFTTLQSSIHDEVILGSYNAEYYPWTAAAKYTVSNIARFFSESKHKSSYEYRDTSGKNISIASIQPDQPTTILCSHFAAMTLQNCLRFLNQTLKSDLQSELKSKGLTGDIIRNPFASTEFMFGMDPYRLFQALKEQDLLIKVETPKVVESYFQKPP